MTRLLLSCVMKIPHEMGKSEKNHCLLPAVEKILIYFLPWFTSLSFFQHIIERWILSIHNLFKPSKAEKKEENSCTWDRIQLGSLYFFGARSNFDSENSLQQRDFQEKPPFEEYQQNLPNLHMKCGKTFKRGNWIHYVRKQANEIK